MKMVFNELSHPQSLTIQEGKNLMEVFLKTYIYGVRNNLDKSMIIVPGFDGVYLAPDYPIAKWRNDASVDRELIRVYNRINDLADTDFTKYSDILENNEFITEKGSSEGLLIAQNLDYICVSFLSCDYWDKHSISGMLKTLENNGNVRSSLCDVYHASKEIHIDNNIDWILSVLNNERYLIRDGDELWYKREEIFPNLIFCHSTKRQLNKLRDQALKQVIRRLSELNQYFETWNGIFNKDALPNVDPESPETLRRFQIEHTFTLPDGRNMVFSWHVRFTGGYEGRIFFEPDGETKKGVIGHIGGKLPTVDWPKP